MREKRTKQLIYGNFISLHLHREISQNSKCLINAQKKITFIFQCLYFNHLWHSHWSLAKQEGKNIRYFSNAYQIFFQSIIFGMPLECREA
ncbi:hypothetical protein AUQ43_07775 [Thalassospira sp. MCCC 1A01148]|uniref:Uncharacterized protein n=1 Tax=Thalassospira profundimaris TaxID=502049 RepID=A0A367VMF0_9PROT|nr:hypothetical protein AUQ43_07775 [Thalassospira sp. MCCC 1A01148]RCK25611.1 hypothetical protein TH6_03120 [Thalassospira profundimaris]